MSNADLLIGTVKGPGKLPYEFLFITRDNERTRIGEFVYYEAKVGDEQRQLVGTIKERKLVRNLPDAFLADPLDPVTHRRIGRDWVRYYGIYIDSEVFRKKT